MKKVIVVLAFLMGLGTSQVTFGQKSDVQAVETYMDLKPLEVSVDFKKQKFYFFMTFQKGANGTKSWKLLVSKNKELLTALQSQNSFDHVKFQSGLFTNRGHRKLWKKASRKFNIDRYNVEPYMIYDIFNTSVSVSVTSTQ